jgi:ATP-dependent RNA helicase DDX21
LVGTPGRVIDHLNRGNLRLNECEIAVLDEADEMLNMGFAEDVETILDGVGKDNEKKTQCLMFSATTPPWVKQIGRKYQDDVLAIDATGDEGGARVATTVRHMAVQLPPGVGSKRAILEDIIAVEISKDLKDIGAESDNEDDGEPVNKIAAAAAAKKKKSSHAMQQKIFGKTIVFTETKREADELVSGGVFKSLTAQVRLCLGYFVLLLFLVCRLHFFFVIFSGFARRCRTKTARFNIGCLPCWCFQCASGNGCRCPWY